MEDLELAYGWLHELEIPCTDHINQCHVPTTEEDFDFGNLFMGINQLASEASAGAAATADSSLTEYLLSVGQQSPTLSATPLNGEITEPPDYDYTGFLNLDTKGSYSKDPKADVETIESKSLSRTPLRAKYHVISERKRREKLNLQLISLASLIPGLTKMNKVSIIEDAIGYIKQLDAKVKQLERDQQSKGEIGRPKRARPSSDSSSSNDDSLDNNNINSINKPFREVGVRVSDKHVVLDIRCKKQEGLLGRILNTLDNFYVDVISTSTISVVESSVEIIITGKMFGEDVMNIENPSKCLKLGILKFI